MLNAFGLLLEILCFIPTTLTSAPIASTSNQTFQRLSQSCRPLRYDIQIIPYLNNFTFAGKEIILLEVFQETSEIELNQMNLNISEALLNNKSTRVIQQPEVQKVILQLKEPLLPGSTTLEVHFTGIISDSLNGFYKSSYTDNNGVDKFILATHFESTSARKAFPCWDEPEFKAVFGITLIVPNNLTAISNMPVLRRTELDNGLVEYVFQDSPKMSSYLVAYAVGELEYIEGKDQNGVQIRVYSRPGLVSETGSGEFAIDITTCSLPFFKDYFGVHYPLPKCDMLALPNFAAGAMENWGLVTFRETRLLVQKDVTSFSSTQSVALTIAHELAHMWFGNLVTMKWWTDLWLKEGFATWIEYLSVDTCFPEMDIWTVFTHSEQARALQLDALESSHPIEVTVNNPDEISEIYDAISYSKGSSLIHMLRAFLGEEVFQSGLSIYLSRHAYASATTEDLWDALSFASNLSIATIMRPWTKNAGFPLLSIVPLNATENYIRVNLSQQQFRQPSIAFNATETDQLWMIPVALTIRSSDGQPVVTYKHLITNSSEVIEIPISGNQSIQEDYLVQVNADGTGFYHVRYTEDQLNRFVRNFPSLNLSDAVKFTFINNGFALARAGYIRIADWLAMLPRITEGERSYAVWRAVLVNGLNRHAKILAQEGGVSMADYQAFLRQLTKPILNESGFFPNTTSNLSNSDDELLLQSLLITVAGAEAGDEDVIAESRRRFAAWRSNPDSSVIPSDLRVAILSTVVRYGGDDVVDYLMDAYRNTTSPEERSQILSALGAASTKTSEQGNSNPLERVLEFSLDPKGPVRSQDRPLGLQSLATWSKDSRVSTWEKIKINWQRLSDEYQGSYLLPNLITGVLSDFGEKKYVDDVKTFFNATNVSVPRAVRQVYESMEINQLLIERDSSSVADTLAKFAQNKTEEQVFV